MAGLIHHTRRLRPEHVPGAPRSVQVGALLGCRAYTKKMGRRASRSRRPSKGGMDERAGLTEFLQQNIPLDELGRARIAREILDRRALSPKLLAHRRRSIERVRRCLVNPVQTFSV